MVIIITPRRHTILLPYSIFLSYQIKEKNLSGHNVSGRSHINFSKSHSPSCLENVKGIAVLLSLHQKGSNNNDILDGLPVVDKYVQIAISKLHLLN